MGHRLCGLFWMAWVGLGLSGIAYAQLRVKLDPVLTSEHSEEGAEGADEQPSIQGIISDAPPGLKSNQIWLTQTDRDDPVTVQASQLRAVDKLALVILIEGNGRWMGNEIYAEEEGEDPEAGAYTGLGAAIDVFAKLGPPGSLGAVLTYGNGQATVKQPVGDIRWLSGAALGRQVDYAKNLDSPLIVGLTDSRSLLSKYPGYRRVIVIIGSGTGERQDISALLNQEIKALSQRQIEIFTILYDISDGPSGQINMNRFGTMNAYNSASIDEISINASTIVKKLSASYQVRFPACRQDLCFTQDGLGHPFRILIEGGGSIVIEIKFPRRKPLVPITRTRSWIVWAALLLAVIVVLVLATRFHRAIAIGVIWRAILDALALVHEPKQSPPSHSQLDLVRRSASSFTLPGWLLYSLGISLILCSLSMPWLTGTSGIFTDKQTWPLRPELVQVPAGDIDIDRGENQPDTRDDATIHIDSFQLCRTEVTQGQWRSVMGSNPSICKFGCSDDRPVQNISVLDAARYLNKLSVIEKQSPCYSTTKKNVSLSNRKCSGYRLPTEYEWEYVARAELLLRNGSNQQSLDMNRHAWHKGNSSNKLQAVAGKHPNAWGFFDIHGNVEEWVWIPFEQANDTRNEPSRSVGHRHAARGGSIADEMNLPKFSRRSEYFLETKSVLRGLRCARRARRGQSL